jgi:glycosyltransferase involved in cell wall biosynthesis
MAIKLSLICPVYKVVEYIPELMNSLLAGVNNEQVEVIFVDDGCPEQSILICEKFIAAHQESITFHTNIIKQPKNQGQAAARNVALEAAKGTYIGFIDSDDAISPFYWATLAEYVNKADHDIIEFGFEEFTDTLPKVNKVDVEELSSSNLNPFHFGFFVWTRLYKKALVQQLSFPEGTIYEDIFYNIHAFAKAQSTIRLSSSLLYYRKRDGSTTSGRTSRYSNLLLNLVNSIKATLEKFDAKEEVINQVVRYSVLVSLKGFTIKDRQDRRVFFKLCKDINASFSPLLNQFNRSLMTKLKFKFSQMVCLIGVFL